MKSSFIIFYSCLMLLSGCSKEQVYTGIQLNRQLECERLEGTPRKDCLDQYKTPYQDYKETTETLKKQTEKKPPASESD